MKKSLFAVACVVALVGCGQNDTGSMGTAGTSDTGYNADNSRRSMVTNDASGISGSPTIGDANSGAAAGSLSITNSSISAPQPDVPASESISASPDQSTPDSTTPSAPGQTGDQSNGDLSNRPQGAPGQARAGASSSAIDTNYPPKSENSQLAPQP